MAKLNNRPMVLRLQRLSDGREPNAGTFVDDFTGEVLPSAVPLEPAKELASGLELAADRSRAKAAAQRALLDRAMAEPKPFVRRV